MKIRRLFQKKREESKGTQPKPVRDRWVRDLFGKFKEKIGALLGRPGITYAIDLGSHSLKAVAFSRGFGRVRIHGARVVKFRERFDYTGESVKRRELLKDAFLEVFDSEEELRGKLRIALPSSAAFIRLTTLPLIRGRVHPQSVEYELKEKIPCPLEDLVWNFLPLPSRDAHSGSVVLAAARREAVGEILGVAGELGLQVEEITAGPCALYQAFRKRIEEDETLLLLDLGAHTLDLLVMKRNGFWPRTITQGSSRIFEALEKETGIPAEEIEQKMTGPALEEPLRGAFRGKLDALVEEIERTLTIYRQEVREARFTGLLVTGGASELPGLTQFLSERLGIPARETLLPPGTRGIRKMIYFQAAALALNPKIPVSLLPPEEKGRRSRILAKQIFSVSLVGLLLMLGISLGTLFSYSGKKALAIHRIEEEILGYNSLRKKIEKAQEGLIPWRTLFGESLARSGEKDLPMKIVQELDQILPRSVWLERMRYERAEGKITLEGRMHEKLSSVAGLLEAFRPSKLFGRVSVSEGSVEANGHRRFTCTVEVTTR